jgi:hypothetical protein
LAAVLVVEIKVLLTSVTADSRVPELNW